MRALGVFVAILAFGCLFYFALPLYFPPEEAGVQKIVANANKYVKVRAGEIERRAKATPVHYPLPLKETGGDINPNAWFYTWMGAANEVRDDRRRRNAVVARSKGNDESFLTTEVLVGQNTWATLRETQIPSQIRVTGTVRPEFYPKHRATPDGIAWAPNPGERDRTVLMYERRLGIPNRTTGNLNEAIGRICNDRHGVACGPGLPVGSDAVLCVGPGMFEGGFFQGWYNGLVVLDGVKTTYYFADTEQAEDMFKFVITPDDPPNGFTFATDVCNSNPGQLVVKLQTANN